MLFVRILFFCFSRFKRLPIDDHNVKTHIITAKKSNREGLKVGKNKINIDRVPAIVIVCEICSREVLRDDDLSALCVNSYVSWPISVFFFCLFGQIVYVNFRSAI